MNAKSKYLLFRLLLAIGVMIAAVLIWRHFTPASSATTAAKPAATTTRPAGRRNAPMPPVQVATATAQNVPRYLSGLGTAVAANTVTVTSRVAGQLVAVHFAEGQQVKAGDLLFEIDARPFEIQQAQALGQLAKDQAALANAKQDLLRYQQLIKNNMVSRQDMDAQQALVRQLEGAIMVDQAAVDNARLQLTYSRITAPIDGRVGLRMVDVGNYIVAGGSAMVMLTQTQPMEVLFSLPETHIADLVRAQKAGAVQVEVWDRSNQQRLTTGTLLSLDNLIDPTTGTIRLKARFDNQDDQLFPNQFVNARLQVETLQDAVVIPIAGLQMGSDGHFVWLLDADNKVSRHLVQAGLQDSQRVVITRGVKVGDRVVTDGIDRLTEGMQVEVVSAQPRAGLPAAKRRDSAQGKS
ncbi:MdtA/MuxA family multidrug efflux RND transporter periplasmic adaptor subunit [Serratia microhaemolytica]|uniref:MdtA/MuxA family multidrug efflux RND transporter periplasmic adaptor subunit n=1 Tax=Serratia microhaemolytica TaxID=2675110 RepID=UPI000FDE5C99|nr:MdtA/MuxA family multidrug efflux RND transporter periplasmic adaptor subunit [Serratia microhaemolytica]